jgi:uncharacterized protein YraI
MLFRKSLLICCCLMLINVSSASLQGDTNAQTLYDLRMRTGPGTGYEIVTTLPSGTSLILEARNGNASWVLAHVPDGQYRGWLAAIYLYYAPGTSAGMLPVSGEIVGVPAAPQAPAPPQNAPPPAAGDVSAYTTNNLNVRSGPSTTYPSIGHVDAQTALVLEARNGNASWVLAHTPGNTVRGWVSAPYLRFTTVSASSLPPSSEIVAATAAPASTTSSSGTAYGSLDLARVQQIDLNAYPVVGRATVTARAIFYRGRAVGRDPAYVSKVGDCHTDHEYFLRPFTWNKYNLGDYGGLQDVINAFSASLDDHSYAASAGFLAGAVLDRTWTDQSVCDASLSPLLCEYQVHNPAVAVIMFGTQDVLLMTPEQFNFYLREVVRFTIDADVIPILSTFPGNLARWDQTILYNQIVVQIALDYDLPLINLWRALEDLPNHGLDGTGDHLTMPLTFACDLSYPNLSTGYAMRNLVTMQTLDAVWRGAMR